MSCEYNKTATFFVLSNASNFILLYKPTKHFAINPLNVTFVKTILYANNFRTRRALL